MRIFTAQLMTETNTFAPMPTARRGFEELGYHHGNASLVDPESLFVVLALWRRLAEARGHEIIESLGAAAQPSGRTVRALWEEMRDEILGDLKAALPVDAVILSLHGAMAADGYDDCEGDLLERIRAIVGPEVTIGIELDLHCHMTSRMRRNTDIIIAYKHYPHTDISVCGERLFDLVTAAAEGRIKPATSMVDCHMVGLWHTTREPMASFVRDMAEHEDGAKVLDISFGHGFPWGDVPEGGARLWVTTDDDPALGEAVAMDFANRLFAMREESMQPLLSIDQALDQASNATSLPIVAADGADNPGGGAPSDSTFILERVVERGVDNVLIAFLYDPEAIRLAEDAGVGATFDMRIGGKTGPASGNPVDLRVAVKAIIPDHFQTGLGARWPLGTTAWLQGPNGLDLILSSARSQPFDPASIQQLGIDLSGKRLIVVKSIQHFYEHFAPIAKGGVLYVAAPGALSPDFAALPYRVKSQDYWPRRDDVRPVLIEA